MTRKQLGCLALLAVAAPLAACQATAKVVLTVSASGRGVLAVSVVLDREAAARIGDVPGALRVADLQHLGWVVDPVTTAGDGSVTATIHHAFGGSGEATALLRELGPLQLSLHRHHGLVSSSEEVTGGADLRNGVDAFSDPGLARALGAGTLASAVEQLKSLGGTVPDLHMEIVLALPAHPGHVAPGGSVTGHTVTWTVPLGEQVAIGASAHTTDRVAVLDFAVALLAVGAMIVLVLGRPRSSRSAGRRGHHHDRWSLSTPVR
jgi:hypothetical protein